MMMVIHLLRTRGHDLFENSKNNYVNVQSNTKKFTAVVGVENTVVVDTPDALLILNKKYSQM